MSDGRIIIDVELNTGKAREQFERFGDEVSGEFTPVTQESKKATSGIKDMAKALGLVKLASKAISLVTDSIGGAIRRYDTLNNADRVFENMGFDATEAAKVVDTLGENLKGLPTPIDMAIRNVQLLAGATRDLGRSEEIFSAMNNAILGFGGTTAQVDNAVIQLSQAFANGRIDAQTWNSMINSGLGPTLNALADQMGKTTGELKEGLSEGTISVETFQDALIDLNKNGGGGLASLEQIARDATGGISTGVANMHTAVVRGLEGVIRAFDETMRELDLPTIGEMIGAVGSAFESGLNIIAENLPGILRLTKDLFDVLVVLEPLLWGVAGALALIKAQAVVLSAVNFITPFLNALGMIPGIFAAISADLAMGNSLFSIIKALGSGLVAALGGPVTIIIGLIGALVGVIAYLWFRTEWFQGLVLSAWESIKTGIGIAIESIVLAFNFLVEGIVQLVDYFKNLIDVNIDLGGIFSTVWSGIQTILTVAWGIMQSVFEGMISLWNSAKDVLSGFSSAVGSGISSVVETISELASSARDMWEAFKESAFVQAAIEAFGFAFDMVKDRITGFKDAVVALVTDFDLEPILQQIGLFLPKLLGFFLGKQVGFILGGANLIKMIAEGMGMTVPELIEMVTNIIVEAIEQFAIALPEFIQTGVDMLTSLIEGFTEALPMITETAVNVILMLVEGLLGSITVIITAGITLLTALIDGLIAALPVLLSAATTILFALVDALIVLLPALIEVGMLILGTLIGGIVAMLPAIIEIGLTLISVLIETVITLLPLIIETGITLILTLVESLISMLPILIEAGITILTTLIGSIIELLPVIIEAGITLILGLVEGLIAMLPALIKAGINLIMALVDAFILLLPTLIEAGVSILTALIEGIIQVLPALIEAGITIIIALGAALVSMAPQILSAGVQLIWALIKGILSIIGAVISAGWQLITGLLTEILSFLGKMLNAGKDLITSLWDGLKDVFNSVWASMTELGDGIVERITNIDLFAAGRAIINSLWDGLRNAWTNVTGWVGGLGDVIKDLKGPIEVDRVLLVDEGNAIMEGLRKGLGTGFERAKDDVSKMAGAILDAFGDTPKNNSLGDFGLFDDNPNVKIGVELDENSARETALTIEKMMNNIPGLKALLNGTLTPEAFSSKTLSASAIGYGGALTSNSNSSVTHNSYKGMLDGATFLIREESDIPKLAKEIKDYENSLEPNRYPTERGI